MDFIRLILVLACMSPLFILLAIRGVGNIPQEYTFSIALVFAIAPNIYLLYRIRQANKKNDKKLIRITSHTDNKEHLLTYVFAILLPLYQTNFGTTNDMLAGFCALLFVIFIFGHMELYYMNIWFSMKGFRVLSIRNDPNSKYSVSHVLITNRKSISPNQEIKPLRITDFLLFDKE